MRNFGQLIYLLFGVARDSRIRLRDRIIFVVRHPFDLLRDKRLQEKSAWFINGRVLRWRGNHLNLFLDHLHAHLGTYASYYGDGKVIVDVGASFGIFTSTAAYLRPAAKIYAFEPSKESYKYFEQNCAGNNRIELIKKAVGDSASRLHFSFDKGHPEGSKTHKQSQASSYEVEQTTLDDFLREYEIPYVDLLKIDIEGSELAALEGAVDTLTKTNFVVVETATGGSNILGVVKLLTQAKFRLIDIGSVNRLNGKIDSLDLVFQSLG